MHKFKYNKQMWSIVSRNSFDRNNLVLTGKLKESFYTGENQLAHDARK